MKAALIIREHRLFADGYIMDMVIWRVTNEATIAVMNEARWRA